MSTQNLTRQHFARPQFIEKLVKKDPEALTLVIDEYTPHLYKAGLGLDFTQEEAEELAQSAMVTFFEKVAGFENRSHIRTFIFGIFYNKVLEKRRAQKKDQAHDPIDEIMEAKFDETGHWLDHESPVHPEKFVQASETLSIIDKCLKSLNFTQRMVFTLRVLEEKKTEEICEILTLSYTNLCQLLRRGKSRLRLCIEGKSKEL